MPVFQSLYCGECTLIWHEGDCINMSEEQVASANVSVAWCKGALIDKDLKLLLFFLRNSRWILKVLLHRNGNDTLLLFVTAHETGNRTYHSFGLN